VNPGRRLVLASASPRRAELLTLLGLRFEVRAADLDEEPLAGELPAATAERLARAKAEAVDPGPGEALVVAADTIVVLDGRILGKPRDRGEAERFVSLLAGRTHEVITGLAVRACPENRIESETAVSQVTFAPMSAGEVAWYAATGEGLDKAGAYALQGKGALFVAAVHGSYTNVIGLPLDRLYPHLKRRGLLATPRG
jgi:septum formation protein